MATNSDILILTHDRQLARAVGDALRSNERLSVGHVFTSATALLAALECESSSCVLIDLDQNPEETLDELSPIAAQFPESRFVVLAQEQRSDLLLKAMECGVRQFLLKSEVGTQLLPALQRIVSASAARTSSRGNIVTLLSACGGCGSTTTAINLANELAIQIKEPALLVDLDLNYGSCATCLGIDTKFGIADVLEDGTRIDANLIRSTAHAYGDHLKVLVSPAAIDFEDPKTVQLEHLSTMLSRCRETFPWTVIDAPRASIPVAAEAAASSTVTYICFECNVKGLRVARHLLLGLLAHRIAKDRIVPMVIKHRGRGETIKLPEIQEALDCQNVLLLAADPAAADACINFGRTLSEEAPRSTLRTAITRLAESVRSSIRSTPMPAEAHA